MSDDRLLRCERCGKPVYLMTEEQARVLEGDPARFAYTCMDCLRDGPRAYPYVDALDG